MGPQVGSCSSSSHDVFINFRGEDTRNNFVGHLYRALKVHGIHVFIDSKDLQKGEDIERLLQAIKGSKLSIAVFSKRYAESKWCLRELVQMVECHRTNRQVILPIFFKVKTSDVKNQTGTFEISPQKHGNETPQTLQTWKEALRFLGNKSGWVFNDGEDQSELVEKVVQSASTQLNRVPLIDVKYPVGLESKVESLLSLLSDTNNEEEVQFLGIYGMGGIGKTTIATALYNRIFRNFSKSCFLDDIREKVSQPGGVECLQQKLLYSICREEIKNCSGKEGSRLIKERLRNIDVLLVLDDVDNYTQLDVLAGDVNWFGPGSRIIITTRDSKILGRIPQNNRKVYEPEELNMIEGLQLFSYYAFSMGQPPHDFMQLSVDIVHTTGGLPLALQVLGCDLSMETDKEVWRSRHRMLKQIPHHDVYRKLKISYDNLEDDIEKAMFLDAACCFIGYEEEHVVSIWEGCGFEPKYRLQVLKRKSLIKFIEPKVSMSMYMSKAKVLSMHDQIRDMGRDIADNRSPTELGKHSRVWSWDNIVKVVDGDQGNRTAADFPHWNGHIIISVKSFENMHNLRLLEVDGAILLGNFQCLPSSLRWLSWHYCAQELPVNFYHEKLVMLDLSFGIFPLDSSNWLESKMFQQLKILKLSSCWKLFETPDFSGFSRLERLYLDGCPFLVNIHESIGHLQQLIYLNLDSCISLNKLPDSLNRLSSLQKLIVSKCRSLKQLPERIGDLKESLVELFLDGTSIKALPDSVGLLKKMEVLDLSSCKMLTELPRSLENMTSLHCIILSGFTKFRYIPKLPSTSVELRLCDMLVISKEKHKMKRLELLCLKILGGNEEQSTGSPVRRIVYDGFVIGEFELISVHYSQLMHSYFPACQQVNNKHQSQIWTRLQEIEEGTSRKYLINPDVHEIGSKLFLHVSISGSGFDPLIYRIMREDEQRVCTSLNFKACIHGKDQRSRYCENRLRIEDIKLINPDDHVHEFEGLDWFGYQLAGGDTIEILEVNQEEEHHPAIDDGGEILCAVTELNLFLVEEEPDLKFFYNHSISAAAAAAPPVPEQEGDRTDEMVDAEAKTEERPKEALTKILLTTFMKLVLLCCSTS